MTHLTSYRVLIFALGLFIALGVLIGTQAPASAQEPETGDPNLSIQIIPETDGIGIAAVDSPTFNVGDTFRVSVVALGVEDPGVFGGQFTIQYDTAYLNAVDGSLVAGDDIQPVVNPVNDIDTENGLIQFAASRQGDVENLTGDVVLASLSFEAVAATEPPEGQTTTIDLENVKLGAKGGIAVAVSGIVDLDVIIKDDNTAGDGDITGIATVQGRADDNQAGHTITATGVQTDTTPLTTTTTVTGSFFIDNAPADTYSVTANSDGFLAAACEDVVHTVDALTSLEAVELLAGDINDDQTIDITDAVAIGNVFGSTEAGEVADLNVDGEVDILDLILMAANYGQTSEGNPWVCEVAAELS